MEYGYEHALIEAAGTVVVRAIPTVLHVAIPEVSVGTVSLFDTNLTTGTSNANRIYTFTGGTSVQDCFPREFDVQCKSGLVYAATGTPVALVLVT